MEQLIKSETFLLSVCVQSEEFTLRAIFLRI